MCFELQTQLIAMPLAVHIDNKVIRLSVTSIVIIKIILIMIWPWLLHSLLHDKVAVAVDHLHAYQFQHKHIKQTYHCMYTVIVTCDWASKNGPSGHTKFDHIFQICCIISNYLLKVLKKNLIFIIQKQFNSQCVTACRK